MADEPTYGKFPTPGFMKRSPFYKVAENKLRPPREKKPEPGSNLDTFHLQNQGYSRDEAQQMATDLRARGTRTGFGGKGVEPNRMLTPRDRVRMGFDRGRSRPAGPTDDQRKWARKFREGQTRRATSTPSAPDQGLGGAMGGSVITPSATTPEKPLNFSRAAMIEGAKTSGDFARTRESFNKQSAAAQTGQRMDGNGSIQEMDKTKAGADGLTDYAREKFGPAVEDIRARRDFARGEAMNKSVSKGVGTMTKTNPYGSASASYGGKPTGPGTMSDPLTGKQVPMKDYLAQQSAVQDTKDGTSGWGENRTFNEAGEDYYDPKSIRQSVQQQKKAGAPNPASTSGKTSTGAYNGLSPAMTGDTGTIKSPLPMPRAGLPAQSSGIATDDPVIRNGISTMSGNRSGLGTIKSPLPDKNDPLDISQLRRGVQQRKGRV